MKLRYYLLILLLVLVPATVVFAESNATVRTSASTIENGGTVTATVTLTQTASWEVRITGSGAAQCTQKFADVTEDAKNTTKELSLSCTATSEGTITFEVTGNISDQDGNTKDISLSTTVTVTRPKSSVNTLSDLKVDGTTISGFSSSKTSYTLPENNGNSITIDATPTDSNATVSGKGAKTLKMGRNSFDIVVTAENGAKKTYTIVVTKPDNRSGNNNLKTLSVDKGTINFDKNKTNYSLEVDHSVSEITIVAIAEDSKATVSGAGKKNLKDYINEFEIVVKAENETTKTYVLKINRKDANGYGAQQSSDASVTSITAKGYDFRFQPGTKSYNLLVEENVTNVEFNVVTSDKKAGVSIVGNNNLKVGSNKVSIVITAEDGTTNEYTFNVYKMGDNPECNNTCPEVKPGDEDKDCTGDKTGGLNIWMIVAGIEFLLLVFLFIDKMTRKNNQNNDQDYSDVDNPDADVEEVDEDGVAVAPVPVDDEEETEKEAEKEEEVAPSEEETEELAEEEPKEETPEVEEKPNEQEIPDIPTAIPADIPSETETTEAPVEKEADVNTQEAETTDEAVPEPETNIPFVYELPKSEKEEDTTPIPVIPGGSEEPETKEEPIVSEEKEEKQEEPSGEVETNIPLVYEVPKEEKEEDATPIPVVPVVTEETEKPNDEAEVPKAEGETAPTEETPSNENETPEEEKKEENNN